ncbi:MAG: SUMF1/EgtB/PvdO family nonheme iron enzyme [Blastocatellia bacterium]
MVDIFLSYSSQDRERITPLIQSLEQQGWSVWYDRRIPPGKTYDEVIEQALDEARCVVVVWSQSSVQSEWVKVEADEGMNRRILVPVLIEEARIPLAFRRIQAARLIGWQGESSHHELESLFGAISLILGEPEPAKETPRQSGQVYEVPPPPEPAKGKVAQKPQTDKAAAPSPKPAKKAVAQKPQAPKAAAPSFEFDVVTVDAKGNVTERRRGRARYFIEDLGNNVKLEMVEIPGGEFTMGSPDTEEDRMADEGPQHRVKVPPFAMGKFAVTLAQWRAVAGFPKVRIDLKPSPSRFKGNNLPVDSVSWEEAVEFCARLSQKTGKTYRLPSEAEWEYAARAGTTTPFAFGETITPQIVNYEGNYPYAYAPEGEYREKTVEVGSLGVANAFGLYDMHGNVWEWCEDQWHDSYDGAPTDGRAWADISATGSNRVIRGANWARGAVRCRSARRDREAPGLRGGDQGFRLVRVGR